jgi:hypothetical protein
MVSIAAGQTNRFKDAVIFEGDCPTGSYVFGAVHFLERDTPFANYIAKIAEIIGLIIGGLIIGGVVGLAIGYALAGFQASVVGAIIGVAAVGLVGFFVGAS